MIPTDRDVELIKSHNKKIRMNIRLLDKESYSEIENISGIVKSCSYEKAYDSDIRNTCSLTLSVPIKNRIYIDFDKTWNNNMIELLCGIYDSSINRYREYNLGRMLMENGSTKMDSTTQEISLNLVDLMASLTEERGSQIGSKTYVPSSEEIINIRTLIMNIIDEFGEFKRKNVCNFEDSLPYDFEFESGIYPIDMLRKILDLFPYYEMFYDENGVFTVQMIPTNIDDPIAIGPDIIDELIISESKESDLSKIRNTTEVWGRELTCDYAATSCTLVGNVYNVEIDSSFEAYVVGESYAVMPHANSVANQQMNIQNLGAHYIYYVTGAGEYSKIPAGEMKAETPYSLRYDTNRFILEGELQVRCIVQEITEMPSNEAKQYYMEKNNCNNVQWVVNPDSPYACNLAQASGRIINERKQVLQDGEFNGIYSTQLAYERGRYENWRKCRLEDTVTIETILIPWIDVNQKIQYTSPVTGEIGTWITQSIDFDFEKWTMTVTASRFYPYYPW